MMFDLGNPHPRQIKNAIKWLSDMRESINDEIRRLERLSENNRYDTVKQDKQRALMRDIAKKELSEAEIQARLFHIGWGNSDLAGSARQIKLNDKRRRRRFRDQEISRRALFQNESHADLAAEYKLSRVQIHRIVKNSDPQRL